MKPISISIEVMNVLAILRFGPDHRRYFVGRPWSKIVFGFRFYWLSAIAYRTN